MALNLVMIGPPGAGKGTQAARLCSHYGIPKISTGEIFRDLAAAGTTLGLEAKSYWSAGMLVPDEIVVALHPDDEAAFAERVAAADVRASVGGVPVRVLLARD